MNLSPQVEEFINYFKKLDLVVDLSVAEPNTFLLEEIKNTYDVTEPLFVFTFVIKTTDNSTKSFNALIPESYCDGRENFYENVKMGIDQISKHPESVESLLFQNPKTNKTVTLPEHQAIAIENPDSNLQDLMNQLKEIPNTIKVEAHNIIDPAILSNTKSESGIVVKVIATFRNITDNSSNNTYDVILSKETYDDPLVRQKVLENFSEYIKNNSQ